METTLNDRPDVGPFVKHQGQNSGGKERNLVADYGRHPDVNEEGQDDHWHPPEDVDDDRRNRREDLPVGDPHHPEDNPEQEG